MKAREALFRRTLSVAAFFNFFFISLFLVGCSQPIAGTSNLQKAIINDSPSPLAEGVVFRQRTIRLSSGAQQQYGSIAKKYADQFGMDWVLVMAVMNQESRFDHEAVSHRGAYGLMQIMPMTQMELSEKLGIAETMTPRNNIKAGIYHLRSLYEAFPRARYEDRIRLMLAAYNGGFGRVMDAQHIAEYFGNDPNSWESVKDALSLLTKSNYTLHQHIWPEGMPSKGYFKNWRETVDYVDAVTEHFEDYTVALR